MIGAAEVAGHRPVRLRNPSFAMLLAGFPPLFLGALLSDWAYSSTYEIQWKNFASWLLAGGLVFAGFALLWAVIEAFRGRPAIPGRFVLPLLLGAAWIIAFIDALVHAKDAWASMPAGLILSLILVVLAIPAAWLGLSGSRGDER